MNRNDKENSNLTNLIPKVREWILFISSIVTVSTGLVRMYQDDANLLTYTFLGLGTVGCILSCVYIAFAKRESPIVKNRKIPKYPQARNWAIAGLILIPMLTIGSLSFWFFMQNRPVEGVIVVVTQFDGPEPEKYRVTETILNKLRQATQGYDDVKIIALEESITEFEGSQTPREIGDRYKASILIWGWYGLTEGVVPISVHFELFTDTKDMLLIGPPAQGEVRLMSTSSLESFELQTQLSDEMTYLTLLTLGITRFSAQDFDSAIQIFDQALHHTSEGEQSLDRSIVYFYRGFSNYMIGEVEQAFSDYDKTIQLDPNNISAYVMRGTAYAEAKNYGAAFTDFNKAIELDPMNKTAYFDRGTAYLYINNYDFAINDFNKTIQLDPTYLVAYNNRGLAYGSKGDFDQAIADFDKAIQLDPKLFQIYQNRGAAYASKEEFDLAIEDFNKAILLDPINNSAYVSRGITYNEIGEFDLAIKDFNKAITLDPANSYAYYNRGIAYGDEGNFDQAVADFDKSIQLDPSNIDSYLRRGSVHADRGDYDLAIADFDKVIKLDPINIDSYFKRGLAYGYKGELDSAFADLDKVIQFDPTFPDVYYHRGFFYTLISEYDRAIIDYKKFLELSKDEFLRFQAEYMIETLEGYKDE